MWLTACIRVRCYPYERRLIERMCKDRNCTMSELIRLLVKDEYKATYGELPRSSARDRIGIPGRPPKGGHTDEEYETALMAKKG